MSAITMRGILLMLSSVLLVGAGTTDDPPMEVLSVTPVTEGASIAVQLGVQPGQTIRGIRWYNNDGLSVFSEVAVVGCDELGNPAVGSPKAVAANVQGQSSAWSTVAFPGGTVCSDERLYAVFRLSAHDERTGVGAGGGAGIGYSTPDTPMGLAAHLTSDGIQWVTLAPHVALAVEPVLEETQEKTVLRPEGELAMAAKEYRPHTLRAWPNPAGPRTSVHFSLGHSGLITIVVYNVRGERVRVLKAGLAESGHHVVHWDGTNDHGNTVAAGIYFILLNTPRGTAIDRLTMLR